MSWFLCPYKRRPGTHLPSRYCAMDDFTAQLILDGADPQSPWAEEECLASSPDIGVAVVKVSSLAKPATLAAINAAPGFIRIPVARLDDPLSTLSNAQKTAIRNKVLALGYTAQEVQAALGTDLGTRTLRELLQFVLSRRRQPTYDLATDTIGLDGKLETPLPPSLIDAQVA